MKRMVATMSGGVGRIDRLTLAALGLIVLVVAFHYSTLRPQQERLERLQQEAAQIRTRAERPEAEGPKTPADKIAAFYNAFPASTMLPDLLEKVFNAAQAQTLKLGQGEYRVVKDARGALTQYQVSLPVKGTYPQIRKFVAAALAEVPTLSLDSIKFERKKVGDPQLDAKIKLVVYLGRTS